jgi:MFS family permease
MLLATVLVGAALVACVLATSVWVLAVAIGLTGASGSVWQVARQTYLTDAVPGHLRARALSTLGGVQRVGGFAGPFLGAATMRFAGTDGAYYVHVVAAAAGAVLLLLLPDVSGTATTGRTSAATVRGVLRSHGRVLRTLGVAVVLLAAVRAARLAVIPL